MLEQLTRYWWLVAFRGAAALLFGFVALIWPRPALAVLVMLFAAYALADGVSALAAAWKAAGRHRAWGGLLVEGIAGILLGLVAFLMPAAALKSLIYLIAAWALLTGLFGIVAAVQLRRVLHNEWMLVLAGAGSLLLGLVLIPWPEGSAIGLVLVVGIYAICFGLLQLALAMRLRSHRPQLRNRAAA